VGLLLLLPLARPLARKLLHRSIKTGGAAPGGFQGAFWTSSMSAWGMGGEGWSKVKGKAGGRAEK